MHAEEAIFCVEPCILLSSRAFFVSNECYNFDYKIIALFLIVWANGRRSGNRESPPHVWL